MDAVRWLREKPLVIWGAGANGEYLCDLLHLIDVAPGCFLDSDPGKTGISGSFAEASYPVYRPECLEQLDAEDVHILVSIKRADEVCRILERRGLRRGVHYALYDRCGEMDRAIGVELYGGSRYRALADAPETPLFRTIEIETINRCNNDCPFCPANYKADTREKAEMSDELLESILRQLGDMGYRGGLSLFSNNEPLLDHQLVERAKRAKELVPDACHYLLTNGSLLTIDKFLPLMECLDFMMIDNYSDDLRLLPPVAKLAEYLESHPEYKNRVIVSRRLKNEVLLTRGGQAPNREEYHAPVCGCLLPFTQLVVRPTGEVSLCCADAMGKYTLGNLNTQGILEVWHGAPYQNIRSVLATQGRPALALCKSCDQFSPLHFYRESVAGVWKR